jgi:hypothetical protein
MGNHQFYKSFDAFQAHLTAHRKLDDKKADVPVNSALQAGKRELEVIREVLDEGRMQDQEEAIITVQGAVEGIIIGLLAYKDHSNIVNLVNAFFDQEEILDRRPFGILFSQRSIREEAGSVSKVLQQMEQLCVRFVYDQAATDGILAQLVFERLTRLDQALVERWHKTC